MLEKLLLIAVAGALGALSRYGLAGLVHSLIDQMFPWGTAVVNLLGCLGFGFLWALMESRFSPESRTVVLAGFMGAFTTFSTYMFETQQLLEDGQWLLAAGNLTLQNVVGLAAIFLGLLVGRFV